ncbi:MAG: VPLPA-CTERM sorting domain-containing protein, partial [Pseudomonadota bacterium]
IKVCYWCSVVGSSAPAPPRRGPARGARSSGPRPPLRGAERPVDPPDALPELETRATAVDVLRFAAMQQARGPDMNTVMRTTAALAALLAAGLAAPASALPVVIDFEGVGAEQGEGEFTGTATEDGFTLDFDEMFIALGSTSTPDFEIERSAGTDGVLTITKGGDLFGFISVDWEAEDDDEPNIDITLEGFLGAASQGADTFTTGLQAYTTFSAVDLAGLSLDRLVISADRDGGFSGAFDTVVLNDAPGGPSSEVPVPAAGGLLVAALGGLALMRRRR